MMEMGADGAGWKVHVVGDFPVGPPFQIVEQDDLTALLRQRCQRGEEARPEVGPFGVLRGGRPTVRRHDAFDRGVTAAAMVPDVIPGPALDDLPKPGAEPSRLATVVDPLKGIDDRILTDVLGAVDVADDSQGHCPTATEVSPDQQPSGHPASLSHPLDEILIGFIHCITNRAPEPAKVLR